MYVKLHRLKDLKVGMKCIYTGTSRPKGTKGSIYQIKNNVVVIAWNVNTGVIKQPYNVYSTHSYMWDVVEFNKEQEKTEMQTVTLLTIGETLTLEINQGQHKLIKDSVEGQALIASDVLKITQAIKQDGQYFALNPLKVTLPKTCAEQQAGFGLCN